MCGGGNTKKVKHKTVGHPSQRGDLFSKIDISLYAVCLASPVSLTAIWQYINGPQSPEYKKLHPFATLMDGFTYNFPRYSVQLRISYC